MGTANTAVAFHNKQLLALHEADLPYAVRLYVPSSMASPADVASFSAESTGNAGHSTSMNSPACECVMDGWLLTVALSRAHTKQQGCSRVWLLTWQVRVHSDARIETLGRETYGGGIARPFTAHPKVDPVTGGVPLRVLGNSSPWQCMRVHACMAMTCVCTHAWLRNGMCPGIAA